MENTDFRSDIIFKIYLQFDCVLFENHNWNFFENKNQIYISLIKEILLATYAQTFIT